MEATNGTSNGLKINDNKILRISTSDDSKKSDEEVQILHFECQNFEKFEKILENLNFDDFPNVFIIIAEIIFDDHKKSEVLSKLSQKIIESRIFFVQIKVNNENVEEFQKHKRRKNFELIIDNFEAKNRLSINQFLQKRLLTEVDNLSSLHERLENEIEAKNEIMVKFLTLFIDDFDENLQKLFFESKNIEIILTILNNSTKLETVRGVTKLPIKKEILIKIAETGNLKALKIVLSFPHAYPINFTNFRKMREIATKIGLHKFLVALHKIEAKFYKKNDFNPEILHNFIKRGNFRKTEQFVGEFPYFKICLNKNGKTVLETANKFNQPKIFEFLLKNGFLCENQTEFLIENVQTHEEIEKATKSKYLKKVHKFSYNDLQECSKKFILDQKVIFQGKETILSEIFTNPQEFINSGALGILCSPKKPEKIYINMKTIRENWENFIPRKIEKKIKMKRKVLLTEHPLNSTEEYFEFCEFSEEAFIRDTRSAENFANIVVMSDSAGNGKTILFEKLSDEMKNFEIYEEISSNFVVFICLKEHTDEFNNFVHKNFTDFIVKILKFEDLVEAIFRQKFAKGETIIFFDAFDEFPQKGRENAIEVFQLFQSALNPENSKNQIFISTRSHFEEMFEEKLRISAHRIKILHEKDQIEFLTNFWHDSTLEIRSIENCAEKLVQKISKIIASQSSLIGVPIILQGLAEVFQSKIDEMFENQVENLNISEIYRKIALKKLLMVAQEKHGHKIANISEKVDTPIYVHRVLAIKNLFGEQFVENLGLFYEKDDWPLDEIALCGIIQNNVGKKIKFYHDSNAEFLASHYLFSILKNNKILTNFQKSFLLQILMEEKFSLARMFFDSMLENDKDYENEMEIFRLKNYFFNENLDFLNLTSQEGLFNIFEFFMSFVFKLDIEYFKELLRREALSNKRTIFMEILTQMQKAGKLKKFIDKIIESKFSFKDLLTQKDAYGDNILRIVAEFSKQKDIFQILNSKSEEVITDKEELKNIFMQRGFLNRNLLQSVVCNRNASVETVKDIFELNWKYFDENPENFKNFICENDENKFNLITYALLYGNQEILGFIFKKLKNIYGESEMRNFLEMKGGMFDQNLLTIVGENPLRNSKVFLWKIFKENYTDEKLSEILVKRDSDNFSLISRSALAGSEDTLKVIFEKIKEFFDAQQVKIFLKVKGGYFDQNLLTIVRENSSKKSQEYLWQVFHENFNLDELADILREKDNQNEFSLISRAVLFDGEESLKFIFGKIEEIFGFEKVKSFLEERGGMEKLNLLNIAKENSNETAREFMMNIFEKHFTEDEISKFLAE